MTVITQLGLATKCLDYFRFGSRECCSPAPTDTDEDWLLLCNPGQAFLAENYLQVNGWFRGGSFAEFDLGSDLKYNPTEEDFVNRVGIDNPVLAVMV